MIQPVNNHLLIEPLKHESFMASQRETFEEIGVVIATGGYRLDCPDLQVGTRVFFDSWLAAKYPKGEDGYYWLVKWNDIRAIDNEAIPEQRMS